MVSILAAFPSLDDAWQYMMSILDQTQRIEVAEDVAHLHVLLAEKMGYEHQNMTAVLKRDWKSVGMTKKTMNATSLQTSTICDSIQKKNTGYRASTLVAINKYWGRALYKRSIRLARSSGQISSSVEWGPLYGDTGVHE